MQEGQVGLRFAESETTKFPGSQNYGGGRGRGWMKTDYPGILGVIERDHCPKQVIWL